MTRGEKKCTVLHECQEYCRVAMLVRCGSVSKITLEEFYILVRGGEATDESVDFTRPTSECLSD